MASDTMPEGFTLYRFTTDLVVEGELSGRRVEQIARELSENLHATVVESDDSPQLKVEKFADGHPHDTTEGRCNTCIYEGHDEKNGNTVVYELQQHGA